MFKHLEFLFNSTVSFINGWDSFKELTYESYGLGCSGFEISAPTLELQKSRIVFTSRFLEIENKKQHHYMICEQMMKSPKVFSSPKYMERF